jgi:hypothetical protein
MPSVQRNYMYVQQQVCLCSCDPHAYVKCLSSSDALLCQVFSIKRRTSATQSFILSDVACVR